MDLVGKKPAPGKGLKLQLWGIVFQDQFGNFVIVDPQKPRPMGLNQEMKRPPTVYVAATDLELETALEEVLFHFKHATSVTTRHLDLVEKVEEARDQHWGVPKRKHRIA